MTMFRRIKVLLAYDRKTLLLFWEAFFFLGWARIALFRPFVKVAPTLGVKSLETSFDSLNEHRTPIKHVAQAVNVMSWYTPWESKCFVKAIAGMKMLERRKIESTLYLGTAKDENGHLIAHAWLRSGPLYVTGADVMKRYVVVEKFANFRRD